MLLVTIAILAVTASSFAAPQQKDPVAIVKLSSDVSPDGTFSYEYETSNQIKAEARGALTDPETLSVQGSYSFVADDGQTYSVTYVANQDGFQPQGAHLPKAPPIPEAIQKALAYIAAHPPPPDKP